MPGRPASDSGGTRRARGGGALLAGGTALLLLGLVARMLLGARAEMHHAAAAATRGDQRAEVQHFRRAMAYYLPGNPWVRRAHDALLQVGIRAMDRGQNEIAADALEQLRSAILSLRGISRPFSRTLPEVNRRLAALRSHEPQAAPALRTPEGERRLLLRLEHPPEPEPLWAGLGLAGFLVWVASAFLLLYRGIRPDAALVRRRFWPLLGIMVGGMALFCLGMAWA